MPYWRRGPRVHLIYGCASHIGMHLVYMRVYLIHRRAPNAVLHIGIAVHLIMHLIYRRATYI